LVIGVQPQKMLSMLQSSPLSVQLSLLDNVILAKDQREFIV